MNEMKTVRRLNSYKVGIQKYNFSRNKRSHKPTSLWFRVHPNFRPDPCDVEPSIDLRLYRPFPPSHCVNRHVPHWQSQDKGAPGEMSPMLDKRVICGLPLPNDPQAKRALDLVPVIEVKESSLCEKVRLDRSGGPVLVCPEPDDLPLEFSEDLYTGQAGVLLGRAT